MDKQREKNHLMVIKGVSSVDRLYIKTAQRKRRGQKSRRVT